MTDSRKIRLGTRLDNNLNPGGGDLWVGMDCFRDHAIVLGAQGSGKTSFGMQLIDEFLDNDCAVLILDTTGEMTAAYAEKIGAAPVEGFADTEYPADPRLQLNVVDLDSAVHMFHRPFAGQAGSELWAEAAHSLVVALLDLLGYRVRGITPEVALLENLVVDRWSAGVDLSLPDLIALVSAPPIKNIGVFELDQVISRERRGELAASLASILDMPGLASTSQVPVDVAALLSQPDGTPAASIISFQQRSSDVRRFLAAVIFAHLAAHAEATDRGDELRLVVYIDEASDFLPATSKVVTTGPLLEILDGWSRFGVGVVLVAGEPSEILEDAIGKVETWIAGRFPVSPSRSEVVAELDLVNPPIDEVQLDLALKQMGVGQFVIKSLRLPTLEYFQSAKWS